MDSRQVDQGVMAEDRLVFECLHDLVQANMNVGSIVHERIYCIHLQDVEIPISQVNLTV